MRSCPLCGGTRLHPILERRNVPVFQNALYASQEAAIAAPVGHLLLCICDACGFVFNATFDPEKVAYDGSYENDQGYSTAFVRHLEEVAERVLAGVKEGALVLEVGCGQGHFLERLLRGRPLRGIGFDPAFRGMGPAGVRIEAKRFDRSVAESLGEAIGGVVSRHVIEHIAEPVSFLKAIAAAIPDGTRLFLETPCVQWIFRGEVLQDVFYEHCNYFTADTLRFAMEQAGFTEISVEALFGEQYLLASGKRGGEGGGTMMKGGTMEEALRYGAATQQKLSALQAAFEEEPTALWGAGAKGVTFAGLVDPSATTIPALIDVNPRKQGHFVPVTGHPILSPAEAAQKGIRKILVMNPNYREEIAASIRAQGWPFTLWE